MKKLSVVPPRIVPYIISDCLLRTSALSIGSFKRSYVSKAAKLAVYDETKINVKKDHTVDAIRDYILKIL